MSLFSLEGRGSKRRLRRIKSQTKFARDVNSIGRETDQDLNRTDVVLKRLNFKPLFL
jgi:hypothetical protein